MKQILADVCGVALLAGVVAAQVPLQDGPSASRVVEDCEPITPIPQPPLADPKKVALGERLFGDPRLSADGTFACSSCHDVSTNGADGTKGRKDASEALDTLTVFNAALSFRLTWGGRFRTLADQAEASIANPANMHSSVPEVVQRLKEDIATNGAFRVAYGRDVDRDSVLDAIVTFERSLLTPGSRFDRWLGGDTSALSPAELDGYRTFKAFGCSSCHQGVNIGANLFARQGMFRPLVSRGPTRVRVPSLRNVAATAPYFHDGSAATLEVAVRRMAAAQLDRTLSDDQVASLVAFLSTLTGNYRGKPVSGGAP
ncbi:cytochrome c peroxidase [Bradyrhizobium japonicum]|uniref:cytochrome-c peroxidase n=1 Tax=Bradyrhizobium TaxID=374 RepID=UPI0003F865AB|nr:MULTISPECIES: cytochrome c peroxidase [Bradyrhizobium]MBR0884389.1 c-type cytochrome [Bradyrhizobium liaoningense]MBR0999556.1 c-type cytochrome [Bradyrhizobium liaoningense]MCP1740171.1 cytochrome c peroxidase [Bradyrhizobium japonicum]MCP1778404.1 cytochrome c peroxidase [Bradyrhizobium japonicum]MCP1857847.1 cytochrome c peroxidase [Bradyrhizobium japonicum]